MNYDALMGFEIPGARQTYGPLDAVRYALSIGLGHDPLDPWQLQFVDDHKGPRIVPSLCSVLGHPGFWLADPRTTVDAGRLVHAEQGFRLATPIPSAGTVVGDTRIVDIVDKGAAKDALLYRLNGDPNPLHLDPAAAREAGFDRPILHGLCTFGIVCHAILREIAGDGPESLRSMSARFSAPVFPGETVAVEMWRNGAFRARAVERDVFVLRRGLATFG